MLLYLPGSLSVTVSGVASVASLYDLSALIQPHTVRSVTPLRGLTTGGTPVTVHGTLFGGDATVLFLERNSNGTLTGNSSECAWRSGGMPGAMCNDTVVRWVTDVFVFAPLFS